MKRFAGSFSEFFVYSNLFIAGCALLMVNQTSQFLLHEPRAGFDLMCFVVFSTICSYSFHWYLTTESAIPSKRIQWLGRYRWILTILFFIGLIGSVIFVIDLLSWWPWLLIAAVMTFLYSAPKIPHKYFRILRRVALGKTIFLAFVWMYVTTVLPIVVSEQPWNTGFILFVVHRFFYIYAICILFDYRDRTDDKASGVRSLITYLPVKGITAIFILSLMVGTIAAFGLYKYGYDWLSISLLIIPGIITFALYNYARKNFSDMLYYFVLDGLMALSAILMLIARI